MKKKLLKTLLVFAVSIVAAFAFGACAGNNEQVEQTEIEKVYAQYVIHAEAEGETPLSYEEWLATIKGEKGDKGDKGETGEQGPQGEKGETGADGKSAYQIWLDNGHEGTEEDFLAWLKNDGQTSYSQNLAYTISEDRTYYILRGMGLCADRDIVIPNTYLGLPVKEIGKNAFNSESTINSIVIPDSVTTIGDYAFEECDSLTSIIIGDSVTTIGNRAFEDCTSLTSVYYKGTAEEWSGITISSNNSHLTSATQYYYIENEADVPTDGGKYWHYDEKGNVAIW